MDKKKRNVSYIVSFDTFMLQPVIKGNKLSTRIIERNRELDIPGKPLHIVKESFSHYGGSLQNSMNTAKLTFGKRHKTPIILAHDFGVPYIFIPTMSPASELNTWILHSAIENIEEDNLGSIIHFENNRSFKVNVSATTMYRQSAFATILEKNFYKKQRGLNRPSTFDPDDDSDDD